MGRHLGIDFLWILVDFGGHVGAKLRRNSIKMGGIVKQMPKSIIRELRRGGDDKRLRGEEKRKDKFLGRPLVHPGPQKK